MWFLFTLAFFFFLNSGLCFWDSGINAVHFFSEPCRIPVSVARQASILQVVDVFLIISSCVAINIHASWWTRAIVSLEKWLRRGISGSQGVHFLLHEMRTDCFQCGCGTSIHRQCQVDRWSTPSSALDTVSFKIFYWSDVYKMGSRWGLNFHFRYWWGWINCIVSPG